MIVRTPVTLKQILKDAKNRLKTTSPTAHVDAELLLTKALQTTRAFLYSHPDNSLTQAQKASFNAALERRLAGETIAYILGHQGFWTLDLIVTPDTLIPRPETELLVELALQHLPANRDCCIADLGTGCGSIALAIASERPNWTVHATDQSKATLDIARQNAEHLAIKNVACSQGTWCDALPHRHYDAILSNPPYIALDDSHLHQGDLRFEPKAALIAGQDGLDAIRIIVVQSKDYLIDGGWLMVEHGYQQGTAVKALFAAAGFKNIADHTDNGGIDRVTIGSLLV